MLLLLSHRHLNATHHFQLADHRPQAFRAGFRLMFQVLDGIEPGFDLTSTVISVSCSTAPLEMGIPGRSSDCAPPSPWNVIEQRGGSRYREPPLSSPRRMGQLRL